MKAIPLTQGYSALIDDDDFETVSKHKWQAVKKGKAVYARRCVSVDGRQSGKQYLHVFLMGERPGMEVDHRSGDSLDNQRHNLRWATSSQQKWNTKISCRNTSGVKGVSWLAQRGRWQAYITVGRKMKHLGKFITFEDAVKARKEAEAVMHGEFARAA